MTYKLYGGPGSPYSHKLRAVLRYRRIPHTWLVPQGGFTGTGALGADGASSPLQQAGKPVIPVLAYPDGSFKADSTPIMYDLEARHSERSLVPPDRALAFLAHLIEDMADEYLPIPMFYFRWTDDKQWCARRQMIGWTGAIDDAQLETMATSFLDRQTGQLGAAAAMPRESVLANYTTFLAALEAHLQQSLFLFGSRPSFAEFGLYGQLTQYLADPTLSAIMRERALRVFQWVHFIDDLSGYEGEWAAAADCLTPSLQQLLASLAPGYFMMAKAMQARVGMAELESAAHGPKYRVKCWLALKQELADLDASERALIQPLLAGAGCWEALQFEGDEAAHVVAIKTH
jgi:glutathione S-transferase